MPLCKRTADFQLIEKAICYSTLSHLQPQKSHVLITTSRSTVDSQWDMLISFDMTYLLYKQLTTECATEGMKMTSYNISYLCPQSKQGHATAAILYPEG